MNNNIKKINIVGLGPGNIEYITNLGVKYIKKCQIAIGGERQLNEVEEFLSKECIKYRLGKLSDVIEYIKENRDKDITIIVSGDTGFYSLLTFLKKYFSKNELNVIAGISSFQYLFAKLGEDWNEYQPMSVHGREMDYIDKLTYVRGIILLTDEKNTPFVIAKNIYDNGFRNMEIIVGERLSYEDENIIRIKIEDYQFLNRDFKMNVVVVRKI